MQRDKGKTLNVVFASSGRSIGAVLNGFRLIPTDKLTIFTSSAMEQYAEEIKRKILDSFSIVPNIVLVNPFDLMDCVTKIITEGQKTMDEAREQGWNDILIRINMTGGTNIMASSMLLAGYILSADVFYVKEGIAADGSTNVELAELIEVPLPRVFYENLSPQRKKILHFLIAVNKISLASLKQRLNFNSTSALKRHTDYLEEAGLIISERSGKKKLVSLSNSGKIIAALHRSKASE